MRMKAFQCLLSFIALLGTVHASISPIAECTAQAWVRAPDLTPDTIVRGDVRVKISAECPAVETVSLGLRLKERSFVKALYDPFLPQFSQILTVVEPDALRKIGSGWILQIGTRHTSISNEYHHGIFRGLVAVVQATRPQKP